MAFSRKFLSALGIEQDKVDEIINAHTEVTDALKTERDKYKADAEQLESVQKELADLKKDVDTDATLKEDYDKLKKEFESFKTNVKEKETTQTKSKAYKDLLSSVGIAGKRADKILKVTDLNAIQLDKEGSIKDSEQLMESIKEEWAEFIPTKQTEGAETNNPPANKGGGKTKEEIMAIKDTAARQQAMAENLELFGI